MTDEAWPVGISLNVNLTFRNEETGALEDPPSARVYLTDPTGEPDIVTPVRLSTGIWSIPYIFDVVGDWKGRGESTTPGVVSEDFYVHILPTRAR